MVLEGLRSAAWLRAQPSPVIHLYLYTLYHNDFYLRIIQTQPLGPLFVLPGLAKRGPA